MSWTLKVRDKFSAAHYLEGYRGKCERVHGHTFHVEIEVVVRELDRTGIGIDFADLKKSPGRRLARPRSSSTSCSLSTRPRRTSPDTSTASSRRPTRSGP
jgi:hypothetical protein